MPYTVRSSERLRNSCAEAETKAMLYLMNFRDDSEDIYYFVVDFFNDVTGMSRTANRLWDLQSKGERHPSPKAIGQELVTLFKNYRSDIEFACYILFLGGATGTLRIDNTLTIFGIDNIKETAIINIKEGLIEECKEKTYIDDSTITDEEIARFLTKVVFVIDDKEKHEYVRTIIKMHPHIIPSEGTLVAIFNEIRDTQSAKKNINSVEGITIETTDEVLSYCRHMTSSEIKMMVLQRIINQNPMHSSFPSSFLSVYQQFPPERQRDQLEQCRSALCRALFNKNCAQGFWTLFEGIYKVIMDYPGNDVSTLYRMLDDNILDQSPDFDVISCKYFIAIVKDGIQQ